MMPARTYILRSELVNADSYVLFPTTDVRASRRSVTFRRVIYIQAASQSSRPAILNCQWLRELDRPVGAMRPRAGVVVLGVRLYVSIIGES